MTKPNEIKLGYDKTNKRFQKIVDGKQWRSSRGLLNTQADKRKAVAEFLNWQLKQDDDKPLEPGAWMFPSGPNMGDPENYPPHLNPVSPIKLAYEAGLAAVQRKEGKKLLSDLFKTWIESKKGSVVDGEIERLEVRLNWFKPHLEVYEMNLELWESLFNKIKANRYAEKEDPEQDITPWSPTYARSYWRDLKSFFNWLEETTRIDSLPKYIRSKTYKIKVPHTLPQFYEPEEIKQIFELATDEQKLHYKLLLNCGMTAIDLSQLDWTMFNLKNKTLTRKRTKHEEKESDKHPTVVYTLWDSIVEELKKREKKEGRVFSNAKGNALVQKNRNDAVALAFEPIQAAVNPDKSIKHFRKTGATMLGQKPLYKLYQETYLANAPGPDDTTAKSYDGTTVLPAEVTEHIRTSLGL